ACGHPGRRRQAARADRPGRRRERAARIHRGRVVMLNVSIETTRDPCRESAPDIEAEAFGALAEHWYVACTEAEVKRAKPLGTRILGLGIVLFRAADGEIVALVDQCVHRGTRLSAGRIADDCLVCPYHGWHYDRHGSITRIPSIDGASGPPTGAA